MDFSIKRKTTLTTRQAIVWENITFFAVTTVLGLIGAPLYIYYHGISLPDICLFTFFSFATGLGITVGYHRLFAHASYKASPFFRFFCLFFGAAAFEQPALDWASQHRDHHRYVDTDLDPYNIKKGFFYAHMGWLMFWRHKVNFDNVKDLQKSRLLMNQYRYYIYWAVGSGILLPVLIGSLWGNPWGAFLISVCARITFVYHATFCINSVCHMFGKATYDIYSTAKDHWLAALITNGEGYHNFHHRFPSDYRNGVRWYQWDPSKWIIALASMIGLTRDLKKVSKFRIIEARIAAEHQRAQDWLKTLEAHPHFANMYDTLKIQYDKVRQTLVDWEGQVKGYQTLVCETITRQSGEIRHNAFEQMRAAKKVFRDTRRQWQSLHLRILTTVPS